jgi:hypothetical protein
MWKRCAVLSELTKMEAGTGAELIGQTPGSLPVALKAGDRVRGPATITSAAEDLILIGKGSVLEVSPAREDVEYFTLVEGWAQGEASERTRIVLTVGQLIGPEAGKAEFYVESVDANRSLYRINKGQASALYSMFQVDIPEGNGIELIATPGKKDILGFKTLPENPGAAAILAKVSETLDIGLMVPRATEGRIEPWDGGKYTRISSDVGSWQGGKIGIETKPVGGGGQEGELGPGTFALINNITGEIEFGFIEVDFAIIERAISLTSEFALLAVSNFFGLED